MTSQELSRAFEDLAKKYAGEAGMLTGTIRNIEATVETAEASDWEGADKWALEKIKEYIEKAFKKIAENSYRNEASPLQAAGYQNQKRLSCWD